MMQIGSTLPSHNLNSFHFKRVRFQCRASPLNPSTTTNKTKTHLMNLEKLLLKQKPEDFTNPAQKPVEVRRGGVLQGLDIPWPPGNNKPVSAPEEIISPGRLRRLRRLLSMTAEQSPRNHIAARWREFHGSDNWAGLLDPLDENLRREVVRYGELVQGAYRSFHSDPATSAEDSEGINRDVAVCDPAYRVTKSLYATSSVGLPKWVDDVAPDLGWMTQRSSWIGYVAVCDDEREIARMGRRDIVISLRGTATCLEWVENFRDVLVNLADSEPELANKPKVDCGFLSLFKTRGEHVDSLAESVTNEVLKLMQQYKGEQLSISITGHSLGAALALLVADELSGALGENPDAPPVAVFSFGGPRVGNRAFAERLEQRNVAVLRVVNKQDLITKVPGMFVSDELEKTLREKATESVIARGIIDALDGKMPWAYSHVGAELRVDTKLSPYLRPDANVACCHDLEAYLHLVDGYLASNCPFRANAKRSLVKLLSEQGSNVKKLYTSKAKSLSKLNVERDQLLVGHHQLSSCLASPS